jgi:hypothetical protein
MSVPSIIRSLEDVNGFPITDMNADWESKPYQLGDHLHLSIQLRWSNAALTGVIYIDYTNDTINDGTPLIAEEDWAPFSAINLDGTFQSILTLDDNLAVSCFRVRYSRVAGSATLDKVLIARKRGK